MSSFSHKQLEQKNRELEGKNAELANQVEMLRSRLQSLPTFAAKYIHRQSHKVIFWFKLNPFPHIGNLQHIGKDMKNLHKKGLKTLWLKEKLLVLSNFYFCHNVFKIVCSTGVIKHIFVGKG